MQTESLPSIQEIKQKAQKMMPKGKKARKKEAELKQKQQQERNLSPNLITPIATKSFVMKAKPKLASSSKNLAIATIIVFGIAFITNLTFQVMLNKEVKERDALVKEIQKNAYVEDQVRGIAAATNLYKVTQNNNPDISEHLKDLVQALEGSVEVNRISYERDKQRYYVNASTSRANAYAGMISNVLESEYVNSMVIEYVDYKAQINEYTADFIVELKR